MQRVWVPKDLRDYPRALKLVGVLVNDSEKMTPQRYRDLYYLKLERLAQRERELGEDPQAVLENLLFESWERVDEKDVAALMWEYQELTWPEGRLVQYMRKVSSLQELKEELDLDEGDKQKLSPEEQLTLVRDLSLREFLEIL